MPTFPYAPELGRYIGICRRAFGPIAIEAPIKFLSATGKLMPFMPPRLTAPANAAVVPRLRPVDENSPICVPSNVTSTLPLPAEYNPVFASLVRAGLATETDVPRV